MKKVVPSYYKNFKCIADKCKHSCCIGWEIDIDEDTLYKYAHIDGDFGLKLKNNIKAENGVSCFALDETERCPFLNKNGLCDIILNIGEENLSQICTDHPRFRNYFSDREEIGLGLCCEEACRLILSSTEKTFLEVVEDDLQNSMLDEDEIFILNFREQLFDIAQNRAFSIQRRCGLLLEFLEVKFPNDLIEKCFDLLLQMEILDNAWRETVLKTKSCEVGTSFDEFFTKPFEQLLVYFIYRHIADSSDFTDVIARTAFAVISLKLISGIFNSMKKNNNEDFALLCEICRMYSSEIEYCEENTEKFLDFLWEQTFEK